MGKRDAPRSFVPAVASAEMDDGFGDETPLAAAALVAAGGGVDGGGDDGMVARLPRGISAKSATKALSGFLQTEEESAWREETVYISDMARKYRELSSIITGVCKKYVREMEAKKHIHRNHGKAFNLPATKLPDVLRMGWPAASAVGPTFAAIAKADARSQQAWLYYLTGWNPNTAMPERCMLWTDMWELMILAMHDNWGEAALDELFRTTAAPSWCWSVGFFCI